MQNIKVSIVVPVYNVATYLVKCLDSLHQQTLQEIEIICVDDGSTDGSLEMLYEYQEKEPRMKILQQKEASAGAAKARNLGISVATGEYLLILDSDDYFSLELAEKTYLKAKSVHADIVVFDAVHVDYKTLEPLEQYTCLYEHYLPMASVFSGKDNAFVLFQSTTSAAWTKLFKRSFVLEHNLFFQEVHVIDDIFFVYRALACCERMAIIKDKLINYRYMNPESQIQNLQRDSFAAKKYFYAMSDWLKEHLLYEKYEHTFFISVKIVCETYLSNLKSMEEKKDLFQWMVSEDIVDFLFFPDMLKETSQKIILYGAGTFGWVYYMQNLFYHHCNIVAWVDRNYETIGFPVTGLEAIEKADYDKIFLAVEKRALAESIKTDLLARGISEEKIMWQEPHH